MAFGSFCDTYMYMKELHAKNKGSIGELEVASALMKLGYSVFTELGDNSKIDLIASKNNKLTTIQVKAYHSENGAVYVPTKKSAKGYKYRYKKTDADVFAVYIYDRDSIVYIPVETLLPKKAGITIRIDPTINGQTSNINYYTDYLTMPL